MNDYFKTWNSRGTVKDFFDYDIDVLEKTLRTDTPEDWEEKGENRALTTFHEAAERVPAYKDFLQKASINHLKIKTKADFLLVPTTNKKNYINVYPYERRLWDGKTKDINLLAVSSGTTGTPTLWPRGGHQEFDAAITHELLYKHLFNIDTKRTLVIVGFPMGVYVSGVATTIPSWLVSEKGYDMTVASVGNNKGEVLKIIKSLQNNFDQIILLGHPFFVKDVIETGKEQGIDWNHLSVKFIFASEGFSESWREYVIEHVGKKDSLDTALSLYGTSDMLLVGFETPLSVYYRKYCEKSSAYSKSIFGGDEVSNIFQYNPVMRYIESVENELIFTSQGSAPLIRYSIHDSGGVLSYNQIKKEIGSHKDVSKLQKWKLPFVYLTGRSDHAIIFYGANIYPEQIRGGINEGEYYNYLTGKFVIQKRFDKKKNEHLDIHIESVKKEAVPKKIKQLQNIIYTHLLKMNGEYRDVVMHAPVNAMPNIFIEPCQESTYFPVGIKPRYIFPSIYE